MRWLVSLVFVLGCSKRQDAPPPADDRPGPAIPEAEVQRGRDACKAYVAQVCACAETVEAAKEPCKLARALPEAIEVATSVSASSDSTRMDTLQAIDAVRKTTAACIEQAAKLPALGCPTTALQ